jgi:hypothetical protein
MVPLAFRAMWALPIPLDIWLPKFRPRETKVWVLVMHVTERHDWPMED